MLDTSIGKSNRVRAGDVGGTIGLLLSVEVGLGVVISDGVGEGVGGNLIGVGLGLVGRGGGVVSRGGVGNDGGVDSVSDNGRSVVGGEVSSGDDSSSVADGGVVSHVRGGGSGGKAEEGGDNKSLHF